MKITLSLTRKGKRFSNIAADARKAVETAVQENAEDVRDTAQRLAPVDTGFLRDHIIIAHAGPLHATIESQADYSAHVEWGTRHMAAQPYMTPAVDEVRPRAERRIIDALNGAAK